MSDRTVLRSYFNQGDVPTETQFADLINSLALTTELSSIISDKTLVVAALGDTVLIGDLSDSNGLKKVTIQTIIDLVGSTSGNVATDTIFDAAGDLVQGTGANTSARLAIGSALQLLQVNAGMTAVEYVSTSGTGNVARVTSPAFTTPLLGTPTSGTLTNCTGLPVAGITPSTSTALGIGSVEVGHATDTTISRVSSGLIAVEGVTLVDVSTAQTLTNKTLTSPTLTSPVLQFAYVAKTANYTITVNDYHINCTSNTFTITLETAVGCEGRTHIVVNSGTGVITLATTSSQTISGNASGTLTLNQWDNYSLVSDGANWIMT